MNDEDKKVRLSKVMGQRGLCSRREADKLIEQGLVEVDGEVVKELGSKVLPDVKIKILNQGQKELSKKITIALHKPRDYVSSQPEKNYRSALELIKIDNYYGDDYKPFIQKGLAPLGRLDIDSTGLIIYSQNGVLAKSIIGENSNVEKEYEVNVTGFRLNTKIISQLEFGLTLDDVKLKKAKVVKHSPTFFSITLTQGRKRQIRRMCELVGLKVTRIQRVRVGKLKLNDLPEGMWTFVTENEIV